MTNKEKNVWEQLGIYKKKIETENIFKVIFINITNQQNIYDPCKNGRLMKLVIFL